MRSLAIAAGAALLASVPVGSMAQDAPEVVSPSGTYTLDLAHASIVWRVNHLGMSMYTGRHTDFDATLEFDADTPANSSVSVTVDAASVSTEYPNAAEKDFDAQLATEANWFNSGEFPTITFVSTGAEQTSPTTGKLMGDLTLLGVTKPITLHVTYNGGFAAHPFNGKPAIGFSATGMIKRSEFGMGFLVPNIGDEVELLIEAEFGGE